MPIPLLIASIARPIAPEAAWIVVALGCCAMAILAAGRGALAGTTLIAAAWWAVVAVGALTLAAGVLPWIDPAAPASRREACEFAASMATFCPLMAVLGAKRPQHRAWHWIVLTLWGVLALPAAESLLFGSGREIHPARSWFLLILVTLGTLNYLPTRFGFASLLWAGAELALLGAYLPGASMLGGPQPAIALGLFVAALAVAWLRGSRCAAKIPLDRLWYDFRDAYGAVWAMRIAERVNTASGQQGWGVRLDWNGFSQNQAGSPVADPRRDEPLLDHVRSLLRRFVSNDWIDRRLSADSAPPPPAGNA